MRNFVFLSLLLAVSALPAHAQVTVAGADGSLVSVQDGNVQVIGAAPAAAVAVQPSVSVNGQTTTVQTTGNSEIHVQGGDHVSVSNVDNGVTATTTVVTNGAVNAVNALPVIGMPAAENSTNVSITNTDSSSAVHVETKADMNAFGNL